MESHLRIQSTPRLSVKRLNILPMSKLRLNKAFLMQNARARQSGQATLTKKRDAFEAAVNLRHSPS